VDSKSNKNLGQIGGAIGLAATSLLGKNKIYFMILLFVILLYRYISLRKNNKLRSNLMLLISISIGSLIIIEYIYNYFPKLQPYSKIIDFTPIIFISILFYYMSFIVYKRGQIKGAFIVLLFTTLVLIFFFHITFFA